MLNCTFFSALFAAVFYPFHAEEVKTDNDCDNYERTLLMIKPDGVQRGLIGELITRIERKGLRIVAMKMMVLTEEQTKQHYSHLANKPFFPDIVNYITSGPVVPMVVEGCDVIAHTRLMIGGHPRQQSKNPKGRTKFRLAGNLAYALPGTIRGDFVTSVKRNIIHGSDTKEAAKNEINNFFSSNEIHEWK